MTKSLKIIQTFFKVARIVSIVLFVIAIVGGVGSLVGLTLLLVLGRAGSTEFIQSFVGSGESYIVACFGCITGAISCVGVAVMYKYVRGYCERELADGTPFTYDGAKELFKLGIVCMIIPAAMSALVGFAWGVCWIFAPQITAPSNFSVDVTSGLFMLLASFIFKHGAEVREQKHAAEAELEQLKSEAEEEDKSEAEGATDEKITE